MPSRKTAPTSDTRGVTAAAGTTKARIERAALLLFCANGVDAVTTREIASASAVSEGALYRHYPSKASLAETMFFDIHNRLAAEISTATNNAEALDDKAAAIVETYCRLADEDWPLFSYHLLTTHRFLPFSRKPDDNNQSPVSIVEAVIKTAIKDKEISTCDPALKAASALGVVLQSALHKVYGRLNGALSEYQRPLTDAVLAVLKS